MSAASPMLSEEQFQCSICLSVFTDPVTTPCGHNFCKNCITHHWDVDDKCKCPLCAKVFHTRPELHVNTFISGMAHQVKQLGVIKASVQVQSVEKGLTRLLDLIKEKQKTTETQAEGFFKELEKEISELRGRSAEMFLQNLPALSPAPPNQDWTGVHSSYEGTMRLAVVDLERTLLEEMRGVCIHLDLKRVRLFAVDITLDPDTASPYVALSNDKKKVYCCKKQNLPNKAERFSKTTCVLGKESFSAGKFYFEVQVKEKTAFDLGVALGSINRKDQISPGSRTDLWVLSLRKGHQYRAMSGSSVLLSLTSRPQKVGVFVDYAEGLVSFYDVDTTAHIYSFTGCNFTDKLYPIFSPCSNSSGDNAAPLVITPVNRRLQNRF